MAIKITKDDFVWLDVTAKCEQGEKAIQEVWLGHELYAVYDDDTEALLESMEEIDEALRLGVRICIEGGHLPARNRSRTIWTDTDKKLINGYWYVKISDLKLGSV